MSYYSNNGEASNQQSRKPVTQRQHALLLIAHGSRHAEANDDLHHVMTSLRQRGPYTIVEASFLELADPDIDEAAARCVAQGAERIVMVPYFLSAGIHVQRDLAEACRRLAERFPQARFHLAEPLGRHPLLLEVLSDRAREAEEKLDGES